MANFASLEDKLSPELRAMLETTQKMIKEMGSKYDEIIERIKNLESKMELFKELEGLVLR